MNLTDKLLTADRAKMNEVNTGKYHSRRLEESLGVKSPVEIKAIDYEYLMKIMSPCYNTDGSVNYSAMPKAQKKICVAGITNIDFRDQNLKDHFGAATPDDLCYEIFKGEIADISGEILELSGYDTDKKKKDEVAEEEETVKN